MEPPAEASPSPRRRNRIHPLGLVVLGVILLALVVFFLRQPTPVLTPEIYRTNQERWLRSGVKNYDLAMKIDAPGEEETKLYEVEVRSGRVVSLKINGNESQRGDAYSVRGIFEWIEREMQLAEGLASAPGAPSGSVLRATFDAELGYPRRFMRLAPMQQAKVNQSVVIEVVEFRIVEPGGA